MWPKKKKLAVFSKKYRGKLKNLTGNIRKFIVTTAFDLDSGSS